MNVPGFKMFLLRDHRFQSVVIDPVSPAFKVYEPGWNTHRWPMFLFGPGASNWRILSFVDAYQSPTTPVVLARVEGKNARRLYRALHTPYISEHHLNRFWKDGVAQSSMDVPEGTWVADELYVGEIVYNNFYDGTAVRNALTDAMARLYTEAA